MFEDFFVERLTSLRNQKNVSAREMSLALGQNESYINRIENKQAFPSMQAFFYICEYLDITPAEFFDADSRYPQEYKEILEDLSTLSEQKLQHAKAVIKAFRYSP